MKLSNFFNLFLSVFMVLTVFLALLTWFNQGVPVMETVELPNRGGRTLILDPGHGGADGGAVSVTGTPESRINLAIALKAEQLAAFYGVVPVMTRRTEELSYPEDALTIRAKKVADQKGRVALINGVPDAVLISIHQNIFTTPGPSGCQVFYAPTAGSQELADAMQEALLQDVSAGNRSTASKIAGSIYLMNAINCPAILIECGFLSNPQEAVRLEDGVYQTKLAAVIISAYLGHLSAL